MLPILSLQLEKLWKNLKTLFLPEVTLVIKEFSNTVPEDRLDKLPPMCYVQYAIESHSEEFIYHVDENVNDDFNDDHEGEELPAAALGRHLQLTCLSRQ